jgi:hypothetical protein
LRCFAGCEGNRASRRGFRVATPFSIVPCPVETFAILVSLHQEIWSVRPRGPCEPTITKFCRSPATLSSLRRLACSWMLRVEGSSSPIPCCRQPKIQTRPERDALANSGLSAAARPHRIAAETLRSALLRSSMRRLYLINSACARETRACADDGIVRHIARTARQPRTSSAAVSLRASLVLQAPRASLHGDLETESVAMPHGLLPAQCIQRLSVGEIV